ncbi:Hippocampus abundant transcript-like protein 1 [Auxenochlorella protothecoides]|uniref:Hippocampus abundant transcript-like protein 1 n=1 Tax=Auxenochlorella protothecoides TaxID=3075 RepID=A0A087SH30_AUXPR|nr:Hippocampus abundant transcript-like protein 1 [Auxenochlorella protothecoides]KFM25034.1 Hippocampus abundant transcript-like protein 1 [Auxenochlorella protothecoides]
MASAQPPMLAKGMWKELWESRAWRLFPLILLYVGTERLHLTHIPTALTFLVPHLPTLLTNDFASRRAGRQLHCEDYVVAEAPTACRDAHSEVVAWSSGASFLSNTVISLFMIPMVGHWSDLYGRRPFMAAPQLASLGSLGVVLLHLRIGLPLYWYYVVQVCMSGFSALAVNLAFLADTLSPVNRPPAFGLVLAVFSAAVILGPTLGSHLGADLAVKAAMVVVLLCSISTLTLLPESLPKEARGRPPTSPHARQPLPAWRAVTILTRSRLFITLTLCMMLMGMTAEGIQDLLVQYLQLKLGFGVQDQAHLFVVLGVGGLLVQGLLLRPLLSLAGDKSVLMLGLTASLVQQLALAVAGTKTQALAAVGLGAIGSVTFPVISSLKANNARRDEQGAVQGALMGARAVASGFGPIVFSLLFAAFTRSDSPLPYFPGAPFLLAAALTLGAAGAALSMPIPWMVTAAKAEEGVAMPDPPGEVIWDREGPEDLEHAMLPVEARPLL